VLVLVGLVLTGLPAGSALADTTIGQLGGNSSVGAGADVVAADPDYVVPPGGGRVTSFSFHSGPGNPGERLDFLVLRLTGLDTYAVVGKTGLVTLIGTQTGTTAETFPANIAVQGGDVLGVWTPGPLDNGAQLGSGSGVLACEFGQPDPNVGDGIFLGNGVGLADLNESANLAPPLPTSKRQCMGGGWKSFGSTFKNQGDCVSFVSTAGKNPPSG
jgi:hypothetical protein